MGIKSIFSMLKADRYTQDGCDKLAEDKTYQTGQISEKTGLQKQPDGSWAPPKNGNGKTVRPGESKSDKWKENNDYLGRKRISMETPQGGKVSIYESDSTKQKNGRFRVDTGSHYNEFNTMEEAKAFAEEQYGKPAGADLSKVTHSDLDVARNKMNTTPEEDQMLDYFVTEMHEDNTGLDEIIKRQDGVFERSNGAYPEEEKTYKSLRDKIMKHYSGDSAPRQLTGDTRLRLSQVTDKVYQIGEISPKTGLQKTAEGWKPPKSNASKSSLGGEAESQSLRAAAKAVGEVNKAKTIKQKTEILEDYGWNSDDGGQTWTNTINGVNQKIKADMQTLKATTSAPP